MKKTVYIESSLEEFMNEKNEILEEIWEARRKIEKENKNDLEEIFKKYQKRQQKNPSEYFSGKPVHLQQI